MLTPQQFGAKGDGRTDDTDAIRLWLTQISGGHGYAPPGVYCYSGSWGIPSCTRIEGAGVGSTFFRCTNVNATVSNARLRWTPEVDPINGGPPHDHDISLANLCFEGDANAVMPPSGNFVTFIGVADLLLRDVRLQKCRSDLLVLHNTGGTLDHLQFREWGVRQFSGPVGQYGGGCALFSWMPNGRLRVINCDAGPDGAGGFWMQDAEETIAIGNRVADTTEFDFVGAGRRSVYVANILGRTRRVDVSGHNAEMHGEEYIYALNVHADADGNNAYFMNLRNVIVLGNLGLRANKAQGANTSAFTLASRPKADGVGDVPPQCVTIAANLACDEDGNATHAIDVTDQGGGAGKDVLVTDNNTGDKKQWTDKPVQVERKGVTAVHNG